jgi:Ca-activated chloride channel homolog
MSNYWALLVLLLIPCIWWAQRKTRVDLGRKQLRLSGIIRSTIIVLLAIALAQPEIYRSTASLSVIYLLDISESILPADIQSALRWIEETTDSGNPDHVRYIPFGANAAAFDTLERARQVEIADNPGPEVIGETATNIEAAVDTALQNFAPHHLKRLVLMTDGNENAGRVATMVSRLKAEGVQVHTMPLRARSDHDVWIETVMAPSDVTSEEQFPIEVHVFSQINTSGRVEVREGSRKLGDREVQLVQGINRVAFEANVKGESGPITLEAEVRAAEDTFLENNKFRSSVLVNGQPRILYVEGRGQSAQYLPAALRTEGYTVTSIDAAALPSRPAELDSYDAVLLSDVARTNLSGPQMTALASYVRDLGGGFILSGGENTYGGEDGYSETDIEKILPVTFHAKRPHRSIAMIVVVDKSGSMGGPDFAYTKEAAKAPLEILANTDHFGVLAFDSTFFWAAPFQAAENRVEIAHSISELVPGGETDIYPPLEAAYNQLVNDESEVKHVILLSDGHTAKDPFQSLLEKMAQAKISVSTVALGTGADKALLASIAQWGKGRAYIVTDASRVPQIFQDESELATGITLRESPFVPVVRKNVQLLRGIDFKAAPRLLGYVATKPKDESHVVLESDRKEPVLARWQFGLGKTAAFTSDLKNRWAVDWLRWNGYSKFWSQLVRETMRNHDNSELDLHVVQNGDRARITIDAIDKDGRFRNRLDSQLRVLTPDQSISDVAVRQEGPGFYQADFALTSKGPYVFRLIGESGAVSRTLAYSYPDEFHFYPTNTAPLRAISEATNGKFQPAPEDIFRRDGETTRVPLRLWPIFASLALLLYFGDVYLRRVRIE